MSITYPLSLVNFIQKYRIAMITLDLNFQQELSQQASGGIINKDIGPALWSADITTGNLNDNDVEDVLSLLRILQRAQGTFLCTNMRRRYPKLDPTGSIVGSSTVLINGVAGTSVSLKGLPASYTISLGDYFSVVYGSPSETLLFQAGETIVANGSGVTGSIEVSPAVPAAMAANNPVTIKQPVVQMTIAPGSIKRNDGLMWSTVSFKGMESTGA